jgi:hypothetical protein
MIMTTPGVRLLVCGGRDFEDRTLAFDTLDRVLAERGVSILIHGGARGADALGAEWATARSIPVQVFKPDWRRFGRGAGPVRNQEMIQIGKPTYAVAFPGGSGTADMCKRLAAARRSLPSASR